MSIEGTILKWGNSYGLRISKADLQGMNLAENDKVEVEINRKENPLKEMFGILKDNPLPKDAIKRARRELDTKL